MYSPVSFKAFCALGNAPEKISLDRSILDGLGIDVPLFEHLKLLKRTPLSSEIECPVCNEFAAVSTDFDGKKLKIGAECPRCGHFTPHEWMIVRWIPVWEPLLAELQSGLNCSGQVEVLIPDFLWNIGRAAIAGQSREIFVACGINTLHHDEICRLLPQSKTSLLFVLGDRPHNGKCSCVPDDRIFPVHSILSLDRTKITADITCVKQQCSLLNALHGPAVRGPGKCAKIGDVSLKLKNELRVFMHGIYHAACSAERAGNDYRFPGISQKELAEMLNTTPVMISRAIKRDAYLDGLFKAANDLRSAYSYGERMENNLA